MPHSLGFRFLHRQASESGGASTQSRTSVDFLIDGESLLTQLAEADGGHADLMGCLVSGFPEHNQKKLALLVSHAPVETDEGRVLLYVCPECGDIACGSFAAKIRINADAVEWSDFAYENGYEPARPLPGIGPFVFSTQGYKSVVTQASAA